MCVVGRRRGRVAGGQGLGGRGQYLGVGQNIHVQTAHRVCMGAASAWDLQHLPVDLGAVMDGRQELPASGAERTRARLGRWDLDVVVPGRLSLHCRVHPKL